MPFLVTLNTDQETYLVQNLVTGRVYAYATERPDKVIGAVMRAKHGSLSGRRNSRKSRNSARGNRTPPASRPQATRKPRQATASQRKPPQATVG